jgi:ribosomal protein L11 methyltransferase
METTDRHVRWLLEASSDVEETLSDWLMEHGSTATYREADPPYILYAYFPPGLVPPDPTGLLAFQSARLLREETFDDEDWLAKSRDAFGAFEVGQGFFIRPLWDESNTPADRTPIIVNPGLAFGTGGHETTRMCMGMLEELAASEGLGGPILDIGAGTGILSLTAHKLGGHSISAFDIDPDCGPAMEEFITMNAGILKGERPFEPFIGTLEDPRVIGPYQGLLANILLETIQELLPRMADIAAPDSWLIASGILAARQDEALLSLSVHGFKPVQIAQEGDWVAILARREP